MKKIIFIAIMFLTNIASATEVCSIIAGASIIADDGKYLGKIASKYDPESILNQYGTYGSKYNSDSIWNEYGSYGGRYSSNSPFNPYTSTPPVLVKNGKVIVHLTVNKNLEAPLNPYFIKTCTFYFLLRVATPATGATPATPATGATPTTVTQAVKELKKLPKEMGSE